MYSQYIVLSVVIFLKGEYFTENALTIVDQKF